MTTITRRPADTRLVATVTLTSAMALIAIGITMLLPTEVVAGTPFTLSLLGVVIMTAAAEAAAIDRRIGDHNHTLSLSEVGIVIGLAFAAPVTLVIGRVLAGVIVLGIIKRIPIRRLGYNLGLFALETAAAAGVYRALTDLPGHEPRAWLAAIAAVTVATAIGLGAVRLILRIYRVKQQPRTITLSLAITTAAATIGVLGVVGLSLHTEAALLVTALGALAYAAMRTINTLSTLQTIDG